jgi:hypothetical protein
MIGQALGKLSIRSSFYEREFLSVNADRETKLRLYFISAAICHQTHNLHNPHLNLWGWDYLEHGFLEMLKTGKAIFNPGYVCMSDPNDIKHQFQRIFSPDQNPENCTLDRLDDRMDMIFEICKKLKEEYHSSISQLIDSCGGFLVNQGKGIYEKLKQFRAFSDPEKKKITFFLKLATDAGLVSIKDPENLIPIMDYHMQRVILRMGCVEITDKKLRAKLKSKTTLTSDKNIRNACIEAVRLIVKSSGHRIISINDFFWPLGRSCCYEKTLCSVGHCVKDPCTFNLMVDIKSHETCLFDGICLGSRDNNYKDLWEPIVDTHYY